MHTVEALTKAGLKIFNASVCGLFLWVHMDCDSDELTVLCSEKGLLLAPGRLFSPHGTASEWMRVNVATAPELTARCIRSARSLAV
jgi:DNA-binding transcriptional MocR family regulator